MFTATITAKYFAEGDLQVLVEFSNSTITKSKAFNVTSERRLKAEIRDEVTRLNELEVLATALPLGVYDPTEIVVPPTQAEINKTAWFNKYNELEQLEKMSQKTFLTGARLTALTDKQASVKNFLDTNIKVEYLDFI